MKYKEYITDLHLNLHPDQIDLLDKWYNHCKEKTDFFTLAYYPYQMVELNNGYKTEEEIPQELMKKQWLYIENYLKEKNKTDDFISFLGYEWQGAGLDGDHNIYFKQDHGNILLSDRYKQLVHAYKNQDVIGIPHHLAYSIGNRGKNWGTHDEDFSPFVETYSHHGSSESDLTNLTMDRHIHMGPRVDGCTVMDGLKLGYHFGIIASGDNHDVPALVKNGRAGVWATSYSKDSIWEAFKARRTFGFTDSKISVWSEIDGHPMGSIISSKGERRQLQVETIANSKIERIELYQNNDLEDIKVIKHSPITDELSVKFKFRVECGWGPNVRFFPNLFEKYWSGYLKTEGQVLSVEPVFNSFENHYKVSTDFTSVDFNCKSQKATGDDHWMRDSSMKNEGYIFEIEAPLNSNIEFFVDNHLEVYTVSELLEKSHLIIFEDEAKDLVKSKTGLTDFPRSDGWYHNAYKVKVYQAFSEDSYHVTTKFTITEDTEKEISYFVKVIQSDGQVAWGSPIWIKND